MAAVVLFHPSQDCFVQFQSLNAASQPASLPGSPARLGPQVLLQLARPHVVYTNLAGPSARRSPSRGTNHPAARMVRWRCRAF